MKVRSIVKNNDTKLSLRDIKLNDNFNERINMKLSLTIHKAKNIIWDNLPLLARNTATLIKKTKKLQQVTKK